MVLVNYMKLCMTARFSVKSFFGQKIWKMDQKMGQNRVLWIYSKIWSLIFTEFCNKNLYCLLCSCTILYLGKYLFPRYGPISSQPIRLQDFLINYISRTNRWNSLIFFMLIQIHINQKLIKKFRGRCGKKCQKGVVSLVTGL